MSGFLEDLLCGAIGYGFGKYAGGRREAENVPDEKDIVTNFLKNCTVDQVIDAWMHANNVPDRDWATAVALRTKAGYIYY